MTKLTRDEWMRRYAAHLVEVGGLEQARADEFAEAGADLGWEDDDLPEDAADEEMSYWGD